MRPPPSQTHNLPSNSIGFHICLDYSQNSQIFNSVVNLVQSALPGCIQSSCLFSIRSRSDIISQFQSSDSYRPYDSSEAERSPFLTLWTFTAPQFSIISLLHSLPSRHQPLPSKRRYFFKRHDSRQSGSALPTGTNLAIASVGKYVHILNMLLQSFAAKPLLSASTKIVTKGMNFGYQWRGPFKLFNGYNWNKQNSTVIWSMFQQWRKTFEENNLFLHFNL